MAEKRGALLAGDIGGTKTNLAVFLSPTDLQNPHAEATFASARYGSLEAIVREFLTQVSVTVERAAFGVAGPVVSGRATITNLPWAMEEEELRKALDLDAVYLQNDLVSIATAVPSLKAGDLHTLNEGEPEPAGAIAVVAPGTGLGEAYVVWDGSRYRAYASEGGHVDFGPTDETQIELLRYLQARHEHVSYEWICSGMGLPNIYGFLKESGCAEEPVWLAERLVQTEDPTPVIVNAALDRDRPCELCGAALGVFVSILGAEAGNLALKVLATGGIYLAGGIPPRILSVLEDGRFLQAFRQKGRLSKLLVSIPIHVVINSKIALLGAACHGYDRWSD
jgi:glucokinase